MLRISAAPIASILTLVMAAAFCSPVIAWNDQSLINDIVSSQAEYESQVKFFRVTAKYTGGRFEEKRDYIVSNGCYSIALDRMITTEKAKDNPPRRIIHQKSDLNYYELLQPRADGALVVSHTSKALHKKGFLITHDLFALSPYSGFMFMGKRLTEWLRDPDFTFTISQTKNARGVREAEIVFTYSPKKDFVLGEGMPAMNGKIQLSIQGVWRIDGAEFDLIRKSQGKVIGLVPQKLVVTYNESSKVVPLPHEVTLESKTVAEGNALKQTLALTEIMYTSYSPKDEDFTPVAYGINLGGPIKESFSIPLWGYLLPFGILLVGVSLYVKRRQKDEGATVSLSRGGFSLVELLVVLGVISLLLSLLLPAIQKVRAAADKMYCSNNLKQIGLACHMFHNDYAAFPAGVKSTKVTETYPRMSWLAQILPYIERDDVWRQTIVAYSKDRVAFNDPPHIGLSTVIKAFACPSDERVHSTQLTFKGQTVALTSYVGVLGRDYLRADGILFLDSKTKIAAIHDGISNTILVGERPPSADFWYGWWYAGFGQNGTGSLDMLLGASELNAGGGFVAAFPLGPYAFMPGNPSNQIDVFHFWSLHPSGAYFLMGDASVHFLNYGAAPILPALSTRNGGEPVEIP
jgi:prepilin-type N-terminal cleavage/methylation domain-containing protein